MLPAAPRGKLADAGGLTAHTVEGDPMSSKFILVATLATATTLAWQSASAQASAPVSREQRKADTAAANKSGQLAPAGGSLPEAKSTAPASTMTREQRRAATAEANKSGQLAPAGGSLPAAKSTAKPSTKTKAQRAAEIEEARKKGDMVPPGGGGPGSK